MELGDFVEIDDCRVAHNSIDRHGNPIYEVQQHSRGGWMRTGHGYQEYDDAVLEARRISNREISHRPETDPLIGRYTDPQRDSRGSRFPRVKRADLNTLPGRIRAARRRDGWEN